MIGFSSVFSESFKFFWKNIRILVFISIFVAISSILSEVLFGNKVDAAINNYDFVELFINFSYGILSLTIGSFFSLWLLKVIIDLLRNGEAKLKESFVFSLKMFPLYFWTSFLTFLVIMGGLILLIIPGIILGVFLVFSTYVLVDKKIGGTTALKESWKIVNGNGGILFVYLLCFFVILYGPALLLSFAFTFLMTESQYKIINTYALGFLYGVVIGPIFVIITAKLYIYLNDKKGDKIVDGDSERT